MSDLLPPNATDQEHALADTGALRIEGIQVLVRQMWNPQTCPARLLPWLAWALSVDDWDSSWSEQQKRATIASAIAVQQTKGTIGAVRRALDALGLSAQVQEWFRQSPAGDPYTYRLLIESFQEPLRLDDINGALEVVDNTKSLRSHLSEVQISTRTECRVYSATSSVVGSELTVTFRGSPFVINDECIVMAGSRSDVILPNDSALVLE